MIFPFKWLYLVGLFSLLVPFNSFSQNICLTPDPISVGDTMVIHGANYRGVLWDVGETITVSFLEAPTDIVREKIIEKAKLWERYANIRFQFVDDNDLDADIRIRFSFGGSWSLLGTVSRNHYEDYDNCSMNFGWFSNSTSDREFERTTVHEFGHALGLVHEHNSPGADICWDEAAVIEA